MQKLNKIQIESQSLTAIEAVHLLESSISEGILTPTGWEQKAVEHLFGRSLNQFISNDLSFALGIASSGLRTAGFLQTNDFIKNVGQLNDLGRQHLGAVIHLFSITSELNSPAIETAAATGCFQMNASNAQEAIDFTLIAHKVAEISLVPGIVQHVFIDEGENFHLPDHRKIRQFLGDPDEHISCPTPAQKMLFGETRRRNPNWFNFDFPTVSGVLKNANNQSLETAARQRFFFQHLDEIVASVFDEFEELTGRKYGQVTTYQIEKADYVLITPSSIFQKTRDVVDAWRSSKNAKVGCIKLNMIQPFPAEELSHILAGKKAVTVLEEIDAPQLDGPPIFTKIKSALGGLQTTGHLWEKNKTIMLIAGQLNLSSFENISDLIDATLQNMFLGEKAKRRFYLGLHFTKSQTDYPQHQVLLQTIEREYPEIADETISTNKYQSANPKQPESTLGLPLIVRKHKNLGPPYSKLSRFYQDTAYFFQTKEVQEIIADPFQALPIMPAGTAGWSGIDVQRSELPDFHPEKCTGCGACFVQCPHSAMPSLVLNFENLLRGGMEISARKGLSVSALTPLIKNLGKMSAQVVRSSDSTISKAKDFLPIAFEKLISQLKLSGEKLENTQRDFSNILPVLGEFSIAITDEFFAKNEIREKGAGELFSLSIDPHACTGCGLCAEICPENALSMQPQSVEFLSKTEQHFNLWEQLPDTTSDTINRQLNEEEYNPFAAVLLSRHNYLSMSGGELNESNAPVKTLLHWITAMTESIVQPGIVEQVREVEKLIEDLSKNIHEKLSLALPKEDSTALWHAISEAKGKRLPFDEVVGRLGKEAHLQLVDTAALQRKIQLVNDLKELRWVLTEGPNGMGRSRFGLGIEDGLLLGNTYPINPFTTPVIFDKNGVTAELVSGIFQGYLRHTLDNLRLLRRASLEAKDQYQTDLSAKKIATLRWQDLDENEKRLVPPMLLVGSRDGFLDKKFSQLNSLLVSDFPIKIIVLNDGQLSPDTNTALHFSKNNTLLLSALSLRKAVVFQGVMDGSRVLFNNLLRGLKQPGPAFFHLFYPNNELHSFRNWTNLPKIALETRAFPLLSFDPTAKGYSQIIPSGNFFSNQISLEDNPSANENWHKVNLEFLENEEPKSIPYKLTLADWLFTQTSWISHFRQALPDEENILPLAELLKLEPLQREGKLPVIFSIGKDKELLRCVTSRQVVEATQAAENQWITLREIAGTLTPYPAKLWKDAEAELAKKYESKLADIRADYESQLAEKEAAVMADMKVRLREKLLMLSRKKTLT